VRSSIMGKAIQDFALAADRPCAVIAVRMPRSMVRWSSIVPSVESLSPGEAHASTLSMTSPAVMGHPLQEGARKSETPHAAQNRG
jgi:hypothetical protein